MDLSKGKCVPCEGGVNPLTDEEVKQYLGVVKDWRLEGKPARNASKAKRNDAGGEIRKEYVFGNFAEALQFVNQVGEIAESEGHHPDILLHDWKKVEIRLSTHAIGGLHLNDFVLASKIDASRTMPSEQKKAR